MQAMDDTSTPIPVTYAPGHSTPVIGSGPFPHAQNSIPNFPLRTFYFKENRVLVQFKLFYSNYKANIVNRRNKKIKERLRLRDDN